MAKSKQQIIDEITAHIQKRGGAFPDWYVGTGSTARNCCQNGRTAHDECVMKCCRPWYEPGSLSRPCIGCIDLRSLSLSKPCM